MGSYDNYIEFNLTKNYKMNKLKLIINCCFILINTCIDLSGIVSFQSLESQEKLPWSLLQKFC